MGKQSEFIGEAAAVGTAADRLDMTEFQLFAAAYRAWFATDPSERTVERHFVPYMFQGEVPHFVRHFVRGLGDGGETGNPYRLAA